ncbi:acyltransferase [Cohnella lubricantis]|uniref:Acyltransferase n=1 Tax=Cohnella lubricantis TaxID=2163172 RepID=A0A841TBU8_9BACL|nr:acyltransferase [Cohnella lubricantis]MBB6676848.1 acyltransferase [Cohnella lubricantis]MBP2119428.1 peptidoglycan/LPS O-acetylase OafA/YrhL [Cohnella lubricantis]
MKVHKERFVQLDALRGLAALTVLFYHMAIVPSFLSPIAGQLFSHTYSPFGMLVNGAAAVVLFFVLSGFVLSLPLLEGKAQPYGPYLIRRFFRIYVPYVVSVFIALICMKSSPLLGTDLLTDVFNGEWSGTIGSDILLEHVYAIVDVHTYTLNGVYWSLIHEMRISIIFPFVVLLLMRVRWPIVLLICLVLFSLGVLNNTFDFEKSNGQMSAYTYSVHFLAYFLYGMLLAKYRREIVHWFRGLRKSLKYGLLALSYLFYNCAFAFIAVLNKLGIDVPFDMLLRKQIYAVGVAGFMIVALASTRAAKLLTARVPVFLGNISYSLYLYHLVVMFTLINLLHGKVPLPILMLLTLILSLVVAYASWALVEKPSMALGRRLALIVMAVRSSPPEHRHKESVTLASRPNPKKIL